MTATEFDARALALRWTDGDAADAECPSGTAAGRVALAWALKDLCNENWNSDADRARRAARRLQSLQASHGSPAIEALRDWGVGLACLTEGRMEDALQSFDRAQAGLLTQGLAHDAARCQLPRLIALALLGRHDEALAAAEQARERFVALGDELSTAKLELNLGSMLMRRDAYAGAAVCYRDAAQRFARAGETELEIMADIGRAGALSWQFEFDEAVRLYDKAAQRVCRPGLQGLIDSNRGRMELHRGHFEAALQALEAALRESEQAGMPHEAAEARRDLADTYLALNLLPEALDLYERTIADCEALDAPVERAWAQVQRAQALSHNGDLEPAAQALAAAGTAFARFANPVGAALVDLRLAQLDLLRADAAAALTRARAAATAFGDAGVLGWRCEADTVAARALAALGRGDEARHAFEAARQASQDLPELEAACHTGLGLLLRDAGKPDAAKVHFERAVACTEAQRALLPADEFRTAYGADKQAPYQALLEMALADDGAGASERLLQSAERARSAALRTALARDVRIDPPDPGGREQRHWLHGQWQQALTHGDVARAAPLQARLRRLEHELLETQRRAQAAAGSAGVSPSEETFDIALLQEQLPPDAALLHYSFVGDRLAACVVTRRSVRHTVMASAGLDARIEQLRFQVDTLRFGAAALRARAAQIGARTQAHLQALHALIWDPVAPLLADAERVIVVPHRALHYVPFCALHDGRASLVERHELSLAPSAALWSAWQRRRPPAVRPLRRVAALGVGGPALPHVAREVRAVAAAFEALPGGSALLRLDDAATLAALHAVLPGADVLHLACHGQFRADSPYFSALHLADGPLTLRDASALPLQAQLVTLSACETGLSRIAPGDELIGLVRGFVLAGVPNVLATLWTLDDADTAALMSRFYAALLRDQRPAAALREAQRAMLGESPNACHWGAFALHGCG